MARASPIRWTGRVQRALAARGVRFPLVVLTRHGEVAIAVQAMKAGAVDFLEKPFEKAALSKAIAAAFERIERRDEEVASEADAAARIAALTPRGQDVLKGLARGLPNKTIALDLGTSPHGANLLTTLDVPSLSDALRIAFARLAPEG